MPTTESLETAPTTGHAGGSMSEITQVLQALEHGDAHAAGELLPLVYDELRHLAASRMAAQPPGQTLQATALVHEAWMRLQGREQPWQGRRHFFAAAAEAMRHILIDQARRKLRQRRGNGVEPVSLEEIDVAVTAEPDDLLRVHEALDQLAAEDELKAELVKLRFFVGLRIPEAAEVLGISATTAKRHWVFARAWLYHRMQQDDPS